MGLSKPETIYLQGKNRLQSLRLKEARQNYERHCHMMQQSCSNSKYRSPQDKIIMNKEQKMEILENHKDHPLFGLPVFAVDPKANETEELREKYSKEREQILKKCKGRNLLEIVIENL